MKNIWKYKEIIFCEGEQTRMDIGNNLLNNCKTIKRIICPSKNAFEKYSKILKKLNDENNDKFFIIALILSTTVLAYELSKEEYSALDVWHVDIEYEWFLRKATTKEKIKNKYRNEVKVETYLKILMLNQA